jgi:hypothetical protein
MAEYYEICAFPKPGSRKKKKLYNGYKDKPNWFCHYCKTPYAERHEIFEGKNRQISIQYGFQVNVCRPCHQEMQDNITERGKERNRYWERHYEIKYMKDRMAEGMTARQALNSWMALIGKNYVEEFMPE